MGFRPEPTIYTLSFVGTSLDGLKIRVGCCTVEEFNQMLRWGADAETSADVADNNDKTLELFLKYLKEWNLDDPTTGEPTAQTVEACNKHERPLVREILVQWQSAMAGIPKASNNGSSSGDNLQERSLGLG